MIQNQLQYDGMETLFLSIVFVFSHDINDDMNFISSFNNDIVIWVPL